MNNVAELVEKLKTTEHCWSREMKPHEIKEIYETLEEQAKRIKMLEALLEEQDPVAMAAWKSANPEDPETWPLLEETTW